MPKYTLHSKQRKIIIKRFFWECPYIPEAQFFADNSYSTFLRLYSKWKHAPAKEKEKLLIRGKKSVNWEKKKKKKQNWDMGSETSWPVAVVEILRTKIWRKGEGSEARRRNKRRCFHIQWCSWNYSLFVQAWEFRLTMSIYSGDGYGG